MHPGHRPILHRSLKGFKIDKFIALLHRHGVDLVGGLWGGGLWGVGLGAAVFGAVRVSGGTSGSMANFFFANYFSVALRAY